MNLFNKHTSQLVKSLSFISVIAFSGAALGVNLAAVVDDFSDDKKSATGIERILLSDTSAGGKTMADIVVANGIMEVKGEIVPPRGQPGWASTVLLLAPMGQSQDASDFQGVKMLVKINSGNISISANSKDITNFDYHASFVVVPADGGFHEVKIPFDSMKRAWSEQTTLNTASLTSLSLVAFGMQKSSFDFAVDEVSFY